MVQDMLGLSRFVPLSGFSVGLRATALEVTTSPSPTEAPCPLSGLTLIPSLVDNNIVWSTTQREWQLCSCRINSADLQALSWMDGSPGSLSKPVGSTPTMLQPMFVSSAQCGLALACTTAFTLRQTSPPCHSSLATTARGLFLVSEPAASCGRCTLCGMRMVCL